MAKEWNIASQWRRFLQARFKNSQFANIVSVWDSILPVQVLGHTEFSDVERPLRGLSTLTQAWNLEFSTSSITSARDLAISRVEASTFNYVGVPLQRAVVAYTPPSSYVPFLNHTEYWAAGIRPLYEFDAGNTLGVTGANPAVSPLVGWQGYSSFDGQYYTRPAILTFDPPFILPARMFFTVSEVATSVMLQVNYFYREVG